MATWEARSTLAKAVVAAGFTYDPTQDIIRSRMHAWQRGLGYTWAYDCSSPFVSMIIDCEPFYFPYRGRHWMIELWKGQYGHETGCEIGVYCDYVSAAVNHKLTERPATAPAVGLVDLKERSRLFLCVLDGDMLRMTSTLYRNGKKLFHRGPQLHWWLTGFHWGVFTRDTSELTMEVEIDFPTQEMADAFKQAANAIGYHTRQKGACGIALTFARPHTPQPSSRAALQGPMQANNEHLVEGYNLLRKALHISTNDPNAFTLEGPAEDAAHRAAARFPRAASAATRGLEGATAAARKLEREAGAARRRHSAASDEVSTAYREILAFFERRAWRGSRQPGGVA
jgi:hypothetical protein